MARVQELAQMRTQDRRARMNPSPLDRLMANNPQAALQMQAMQMQQQGRERLQEMENQGGLARVNAEQQGVQRRNEIGGMAALVNAGLTPAQARAELGLPPVPGAQQPGQAPKYAAGNFNGVDKATYDYLKEQGANADDDYMLGLMGEMGIPAELQDGLLGAVKPNFWRRPKGAAGGGGANSIPLPGGWSFGAFGPRRG
jgi:hypothetical protein